MRKPVIGITMGDAAGIGPEIILKCLSQKEIYGKSKPVVLGDAKVMEEIIRICEVSGIKINRIKNLSAAFFEHG